MKSQPLSSKHGGNGLGNQIDLLVLCEYDSVIVSVRFKSSAAKQRFNYSTTFGDFWTNGAFKGSNNLHFDDSSPLLVHLTASYICLCVDASPEKPRKWSVSTYYWNNFSNIFPLPTPPHPHPPGSFHETTLTYKTNVDNFSLRPFFTITFENKRNNDACQDSNDVENG